MIKKNSPLRAVAVMMAGVLVMMSSRVISAKPSGRGGSLSMVGDVEVNGEKAFPGGTVFSDSKIVTGEKSRAAVNLGALGRLELSANSSARLSFEDSILHGAIEKGEVRVSTPAGVSASFATERGLVHVDGSQPTSFTVTTTPAQTDIEATSGTIELISGSECSLIVARDPEAAAQSQRGRSRKSLVIWLAAVGGGAATVIWLVTHDSEPELDFGGNVMASGGR